MTEIKKSYLMWIGKEHYPTIEDYAKEAETMGVSKRLPNGHFAARLASERAVVFLAHDEGKYSDCEVCHGSGGWVNIVIDSCDGCKAVFPEGDDHAKLLKAQSDMAGTDLGFTSWSYTTFNKVLHQPKKFKPEDHDIKSRKMCAACGGTGRLPQGKVFGMFLPTDVEYILKSEDGTKVREEAEKRGIKVITEAVLRTEKKRGCGVRKPGGYYMVTKTEKVDVDLATLTKEMTEKGLIKEGEVVVNGAFARFLNPIDISTKRFRGLKEWALDPRAEDEATMAMEAME